MSTVQISAFYRFFPVAVADLQRLAADLENRGRALGLRGLLIFASEGLNGTICARTRPEIEAYLTDAARILGIDGFPQNLRNPSEAARWPFRKFKVRLRDEIVTLGKPEVRPLPRHSATHLTPDEWDRACAQSDTVVLDTRNWYETKIGKFRGAIDPRLEEFAEFSGFLEKTEIPKDKKILIYCTGGIRCEKAIVEMKNHGFENVFQLDGGILNYLAQKPGRGFEGECFVFDTRVAVDQNLQPTQIYGMCPHCGQPAHEARVCVRCESPALACGECVAKLGAVTCSKNCAHHHRLAPGKKGAGQDLKTRRQSDTRP